MELDKTDVKILKTLVSDARLSCRQIARKVGVSVGTVLARIRKMESNKIINHYVAVLDHEKLGYDLSAVIELKISKGKLIDVEEKIAKSANVVGVYDVTGTTDAMVLAKFKSRKELNNFVKYILTIEFVEGSNTRVILNTIKEDFRLL